MISRIVRLDAAVERWADTRRGSPHDVVTHLLSAAADRSKLWIGAAGARVLADRRHGRRAAVRALTTVALQSLVVHFVIKRIAGRARPVNDVVLQFGARRPPSRAFPSGHAASAAAAALLLADGLPGWGLFLYPLAAAVGWSRVHTGLHHVSDVAAGLAIGTGVGVVTKRLLPLD